MTSKQVINYLLYEYNKPDNYNEIILKALQKVKKDLEILEPNKVINDSFMEFTKDNKFYFCGDAYNGTYYNKEDLLTLIKDLVYYYKHWEKLDNE